MTVGTKTLTKEEYLVAKELTKAELSNFVADRLPMSIMCGYGYYGIAFSPRENNGKYEVGYYRGDSCD